MDKDTLTFAVLLSVIDFLLSILMIIGDRCDLCICFRC